ncbi:MAG TPA: imidazole glycerol phosphate synthase subunit HisH [Polyangiaceae bacterium]|nr:imidazole glycerol phosphate synthase subunit HisH [Polyangiaceae bacterium]
MITIVDYNAGNLRSVKRACDAAGTDSVLTQNPEDIVRAERVIFPGVGAARSAMDTVTGRGLDAALREAVGRGTPVLGICIGAQIILDRSEESDTDCLGLLPGTTVRFRLEDPRLKVPHIGWNEVIVEKPHPVLGGLEPGDELYFVHSYHPNPADSSRVYATANYGGKFCCALGRDNLFATQFHPEKSGPIGLDLLARFSRWDGRC